MSGARRYRGTPGPPGHLEQAPAPPGQVAPAYLHMRRARLAPPPSRSAHASERVMYSDLILAWVEDIVHISSTIDVERPRMWYRNVVVLEVVIVEDIDPVDRDAHLLPQEIEVLLEPEIDLPIGPAPDNERVAWLAPVLGPLSGGELESRRLTVAVPPASDAERVRRHGLGRLTPRRDVERRARSQRDDAAQRNVERQTKNAVRDDAVALIVVRGMPAECMERGVVERERIFGDPIDLGPRQGVRQSCAPSTPPPSRIEWLVNAQEERLVSRAPVIIRQQDVAELARH